MHRTAARWLMLLSAIAFVVLIGSGSPTAGQNSDEDPDVQVTDDDRLSTPPDPVTDITIAVDVIKILNISERDNAFEVDAQLTASWADKRLSWEPCPSEAPKVYKGESAVEKLKTDTWTPGFQIVEGRAKRARTTLAISVECTGRMTYQERFVASVFQQFDGLNDYPFDDQALKFEIVPNGLVGTGVLRFTEPETYPTRPDWDSEEWSFHIELADQQVIGTPPKATTVVRIERKPKYYLYNVIAPLVLIVLISWAVFWMDLKLHERLGVAITTLLTVVAFDFLTSNSLPKLSFTTRLDAFYNVSYVFVALTILVSVIATRPSRCSPDDDENHERRAPQGAPEVANDAGGDAADEQTPEAGDTNAIAGEVATVIRDGEKDAQWKIWKRPKKVRGHTIDLWARGLYPSLFLLFVGLALAGCFSPGEQRAPVTEGEVEQEFSDLESAFGLSLENLQRDAVELPLDDELTGSIAPAGDNDIYRFCTSDGDGMDGGLLSVRMQRTGSTEDFLDPRLVLYTIQGDFVTSNDDRADGIGDVNSLIVLDPNAEGLPKTNGDYCYFLIASDLTGEEVGGYLLTRTAGEFAGGRFTDVQATFGVSFDDLNARAVDLPVDTRRDDSIAQPGDFDVYRFCPNEGPPVSVTMERSDPDESLLDPLLVLYFEDGSLVTFNDDVSEEELNSRLVLDEVLSGCYLLVAADLSDMGVGDYTLIKTSEATEPEGE